MGHRLGCFQGAERYLEVLPLKGDMAKESGKKTLHTGTRNS